MRKISWVVLCFIVFSLLLTLPLGCYAKTSTILACTWNYGEPFPSLELEANTQITEYIYDCSVASGFTSYNWFGSETTENHIYDAAVGVSDRYSISFFIGHSDTDYVWNGIFLERQYWIYDSDGNRVYDKEIYPYTECENVRFVFLWGCHQGDTIGGTHWSGTHYGMPYAWLHTTDLSTDGYANPDNNRYCFIGFDGDAPGILIEFDGVRWGVGYYFIGHFYTAALCGDKTINEALDYASQIIWGVNFGESILYNGIPDYGKMVVYGDGNLNVGKSVIAPTLLPAPSEPNGGGNGGGGGGGECPYVSVWEGSNYVLDNSILPTSQLGNGADVEDYYRLEQTLVRQDGKYSLLMSEFEKEHSYIDQVKLLAVDHESVVNIAVAPDGEILTYKNPVAPLSAVDVNGTDRLDQIRYMDGDLLDPATFFQGTEDDYLLLNFGQVNSEDAKLIVRNDMYCMVKCINVQVMDSNGEWQTVAVIASRTYWAVEGVDLSPYVMESRDLLVRLGWTVPHKLDYVGLDTTKQDDWELHEANLVSATHSTQGDVRGLLQEGDNTHAELTPGQQIQLKFTLPENSKQARTYILYTKGHWYTIQT